MHSRALQYICCPTCRGPLELDSLQTAEIPMKPEYAERARAAGFGGDAWTDVEEGFLRCTACRLVFPLHERVPRLFVYVLQQSREYLGRRASEVAAYTQQGYKLPSGTPEPGEGAVQRSFSRQWAEYDYDGVIWAQTPEERLDLALREIGMTAQQMRGKLFADIGCGNAVLTDMMSRVAGAEAVGLDLSFAPVRAAREFRSNPFLHFVQGSVFRLPLRRGIFDVGYSSGVLHHTYNTRKAFDQAITVVKPGGVFYVWLYSAQRAGVQGLISLANDQVRKVVCRLPAPLQNVAVHALTPIFWGLRGALRTALFGAKTFPYKFSHALHAARDAYTPRYAYHHTGAEVSEWFRAAGFSQVTPLTGERLPKVKTVPCSVRGIAA